MHSNAKLLNFWSNYAENRMARRAYAMTDGLTQRLEEGCGKGKGSAGSTAGSREFGPLRKEKENKGALSMHNIISF